MTPLAAGVVLGLTGGAHCAVMCGPFLAVVAPRGGRAEMHHLARTVTYILLGLSAGTAALGMVAIGAGSAVAWVAAAGLLLQAARSVRNANGRQAGMGRALQAVTAAVGAASRTHPLAGAFLVGVVNGLLPCGLVYSAAIAAGGWGHPLPGALFMTGFSAGTTLALLASRAVWSMASRRLPRFAHRLTPIALTIIALLLVLRGSSALPLHVH